MGVLFVWHLIRTPYLLYKGAEEKHTNQMAVAAQQMAVATQREMELQKRVESGEKRIDALVNANRPEVFATYLSLPSLFTYVAPDSWEPDPGFTCPTFVEVTKRRKSAAYQIEVAPISTDEFTLIFESIPFLEVRTSVQVRTTLRPLGELETEEYTTGGDRRLYLATQQTLALGRTFYQARGIGPQMSVEVGNGLELDVTWRAARSSQSAGV